MCLLIGIYFHTRSCNFIGYIISFVIPSLSCNFLPAVYRGCFDGFSSVVDLKNDYVGCQNQTWNNRHRLWCLCDTDLCNGYHVNLAEQQQQQQKPSAHHRPSHLRLNQAPSPAEPTRQLQHNQEKHRDSRQNDRSHAQERLREIPGNAEDRGKEEQTAPNDYRPRPVVENREEGRNFNSKTSFNGEQGQRAAFGRSEGGRNENGRGNINGTRRDREEFGFRARGAFAKEGEEKEGEEIEPIVLNELNVKDAEGTYRPDVDRAYSSVTDGGQNTVEVDGTGQEVEYPDYPYNQDMVRLMPIVKELEEVRHRERAAEDITPLPEVEHWTIDYPYNQELRTRFQPMRVPEELQPPIPGEKAKETSAIAKEGADDNDYPYNQSLDPSIHEEILQNYEAHMEQKRNSLIREESEAQPPLRVERVDHENGHAGYPQKEIEVIESADAPGRQISDYVHGSVPTSMSDHRHPNQIPAGNQMPIVIDMDINDFNDAVHTIYSRSEPNPRPSYKEESLKTWSDEEGSAREGVGEDASPPEESELYAVQGGDRVSRRTNIGQHRKNIGREGPDGGEEGEKPSDQINFASKLLGNQLWAVIFSGMVLLYIVW